MSAIIFGSIGTISDTSELQRQAFNQAFEFHGLDWCWHRDKYLSMLKSSGGQQRIANYAHSFGQTVDVEAIHRSKSELFQKSLFESQVLPRLGVAETIQAAKDRGWQLALVTTTSPENVSSLVKALQSEVQIADFDLILNATHVKHPKPDKEVYVLALERLGESSDQCIVIEDNLEGLESARLAGLDCIAFPNENTAHHNFTNAKLLVDRLSFGELEKLCLREYVWKGAR
ncbi:MAG: HAD-IA family hydrolase [Oscillatoriales cyanobacterium RM2_1_1]|nr:HAD-IA family hydrolase [Oscillatoriales cyanobacterium SM2_3_0]NJO44705.1 HAD-IA family hydrolase [Oscillatoriales cyanobacterium RM2_1_1]